MELTLHTWAVALDWGSLLRRVRSQSWAEAACPLDCAGHTVTSRGQSKLPLPPSIPRKRRTWLIWVLSGRGRRCQLKKQWLAELEHAGNPFHHFSSQGIPNLWAGDGGRRGPETGESLFPPKKVWKQPLPHAHLLQHSERLESWASGVSFLWGWNPPSASEAFKAKAGQGLGGQEGASSGEDQHLVFHWTGRKFGFQAEKTLITDTKKIIIIQGIYILCVCHLKSHSGDSWDSP